MKHSYEVAVVFRKSSAYCRNVSDGMITGLIKINCNRCDLEALLSEYNVANYCITWCDYQRQIMDTFKDIPTHYYDDEEVKK